MWACLQASVIKLFSHKKDKIIKKDWDEIRRPIIDEKLNEKKK